MKRSTITIEEKYVKIYSPSWVNCGFGYCETIKGDTYFDVPYESDEQVAKLLSEGEAIYEERYAGSWVERPKAEVYWKTISSSQHEMA